MIDSVKDRQLITEIQYSVGVCNLGYLLVASRPAGVCAIFLGDEPGSLLAELTHRFPHNRLVRDDQGLQPVIAQIAAFVNAPETELHLPLDPHGTPFQLRVWQALGEIPFGQTATYTTIALRIGSPKAQRAVGQACGANPLAVAIPCHRVLRSDGALGGYRWGLERKRRLLVYEQTKVTR